MYITCYIYVLILSAAYFIALMLNVYFLFKLNILKKIQMERFNVFLFSPFLSLLFVSIYDEKLFLKRIKKEDGWGPKRLKDPWEKETDETQRVGLCTIKEDVIGVKESASLAGWKRKCFIYGTSWIQNQLILSVA